MRRIGVAWVGCLALWAVWASGGCSQAGPGEEPDRPTVAVTTSWLACAVRDVAGDAVEVVVLSPPGQCPGHFDMKPSQLAGIRRCRMLVRFDFQAGLDERLGGIDDLRIVVVTVTAGLCMPESYLSACREVSAELAGVFPELAERCAANEASTTARVTALARRVRARVDAAGVSGVRALTSDHQAAFARWLGLDVAGTFGRGDSERPAAVNDLIRKGKGVRFVIANRQEGDRLARRLAARLDARLVVFSNFPAMTDEELTFDDLVTANVNALLEGSASERRRDLAR